MHRKKAMEHRERIEGRIDKLLFLGALITNRDPFVGLTVIINLSCRTTKIIYSVKISLTYGILLHANVTTRVPRYQYRMYRAPTGRVIGLSLALFFKTNYSYIRVLHVLYHFLYKTNRIKKKYLVSSIESGPIPVILFDYSTLW